VDPPVVTVRQRLFTGLVRLGALSEMASRAFLCLGVGLLNRSDFRDLSQRSWSAFASTDDEARSGLTSWEETIFRQFVKAGERLCIVGCGSGRDLLPFVKEGHDVVGIEPSPAPAAMLRGILRETDLSATVIEAPVEDAVLPGVFDVVLFSLNCYSYIHGSAARVEVLRKIEAHLTAEGRIFLTYPRRRGTWVNHGARLAVLMARLTRSDWRPEPYDFFQRIDVPGEPGALICEHFFVPEEIEREAARAGLDVLVHGDPWATAYAVLGRRPGSGV
jgi:SAM-dependent methyltransferase